MSAWRAHDAVLVIAFGGPERMEEVRPFLQHVLRGPPGAAPSASSRSCTTTS